MSDNTETTNIDTANNVEEIKPFDKIKFNFVLMEYYVHGNPGNAAVAYQLWDDDRIRDGEIRVAERGFRRKFKDHEYEKEPGWLHIVYKYICKCDLDKTIEYLKELADYKSPEQLNN